MTPKLTIIIPLRINDNVNIIQRLNWKHIPRSPSIEVIVVDDGSENASSLKHLCDEKGWVYVYLNTSDASFSLARARNRGLRCAKGEYIYFEDVDFIHKSDFYHKAIFIASSLNEVPFNFAAVPTLFLNRSASELLIEKIDNRSEFEQQFDNYVLKLPFIDPDLPNEICDSFALVGSNIIVRRETCFHAGLFDEYFNNWGGEDRDFVFKLLFGNSHLLRPANFGDTKSWKVHKTHAYEGWRSSYRLHGDWLRTLGVYAMHIHHDENSWKDPFARRANFSYAEMKAKQISSGALSILPMQMNDSSPNNVFIGRNPTFFNDEVMRILGNVTVIDVDHGLSPSQFATKVLTAKPSRIFFQNPYGKEWLHEVWNILRAASAKCICVERGALPNSIYFDEDGFCGDSQAYARTHWENSNPIDAGDYLSAIRQEKLVLEPQGKLDTANIELDPEKKTILVLLQSLTDATTLHFTSPLRNYDEFLDIISELHELDKYNVLVKNHPLNKRNPLVGVGTDVSSYAIYDLFDIADAFVTLNSGAGLLALATGKAVITLGKAFYAMEGLAASARTAIELRNVIDRDQIPQSECVDRFFGYLINEFYSFADWKYGSRDYGADTRMSTMKDVRFRRIVIGDISTTLSKPILSANSLLMDPFAFYLFSKKSRSESKSVSNDAFSLGCADFHNGRFEVAAQNFDKVHEYDPKTPKFLRCAAEAYVRKGDLSTARERLSAASKLAPDNKSIARRLRELKRPTVLRLIMPAWPYPVPVP